MQKTEVIIIGAGAAGLMCAIEAGKRNRKVIVIDHANKPGKKIIMAGGGRCNFTNLNVTANNFISQNPHFCKSALSRYTQWHFIDLVKKYKIPYHEKTLGQLFCDHKSQDILQMLLKECELANVEIHLLTKIEKIDYLSENHFKVTTHNTTYHCQSLVVATGGLSIPTMGASPFGYKIAEQFGLNVQPVRAGLVPFTLHQQEKEKYSELSGIALDAEVKNQGQKFRENILFTHRGLSGPAILQISSYWQPGESVNIKLFPEMNLCEKLKETQQQRPLVLLKNYLSEFMPKRVIEKFIDDDIADKKLREISYKDFALMTEKIQNWQIQPNGTEGYRTAEVTLGGVDVNEISSKTMEVNKYPGLYFIGEVLDVTGWLGGYNFQWAWSSGWAAGQVV